MTRGAGMPDDWGDDLDGDGDLAGDEMVLDDELEFDDLGLDEPEGTTDDWSAHGLDAVDPLDPFDDEIDDGDGLGDGELGAFGAVHADDHVAVEDIAAGGGGSSGGGGGTGASSQGAGAAMTWSAWDVGTVFAMGGWMLDRHAEQIGREVRAALASSAHAPSAQAGPRGAPHPPPRSGEAYGAETGWHRPGERLRLGRLYADLTTAHAHQQPLLLQAEGGTSAGGRLVLVISVVPGSAGPSLWVVAEQHPGGFAASRLVPVFQADASGAFAVFATDHATEAADAVAWACGREGIAPSWLTVTRRA